MAVTGLERMGKVAAECFRNPTRPSFWVEGEGRYVCPDGTVLYREASEVSQKQLSDAGRLDPKFKLVFWTVAIGTVFFTLLCVLIHLITNGELPSGRKELSDSFLTMAKIGFGAIAGLLGGKSL